MTGDAYGRLLEKADALEDAASEAAEAIRRDRPNRERAHSLAALADVTASTRTLLQEYIDTGARKAGE